MHADGTNLIVVYTSPQNLLDPIKTFFAKFTTRFIVKPMVTNFVALDNIKQGENSLSNYLWNTLQRHHLLFLISTQLLHAQHVD